MTSHKRQQLLNLKDFLDEKVATYNRPNFIELDPISIPHRFRKKQDIEIAGLMASVLAWGQRATVINKTNQFLSFMDGAPHDFVLHHKPSELKQFEKFKHRTFNATDALYFMASLKNIYQQFPSLENAFLIAKEAPNTENAIGHFHNMFFSLPDYPERTKKHVSTPERKSACKRLNMYLRWMVRQDKSGVDFGIWKKISPSQLICPLDVHVERVARKLKLIQRKQADWETAVELTNNLKVLNIHDPVVYDFALFGLGVAEKF
ncbi:MAG: TIGR02757 family protein [Cyclobacteriaceae bacterium]|nr:TIGR02757 family protein [Cyclobacteriaceae bacterium]